jgi:hypothetical protein
MLLTLSVQMILIQTRWHIVQFLVCFLSVATWFGVAYAVTNLVLVDYEWYQVMCILILPLFSDVHDSSDSADVEPPHDSGKLLVGQSSSGCDDNRKGFIH